MNYRYQQHGTACALLALLSHIIVLATLFLSFVWHQNQFHKDELINPLPALNTHLHPTLSAPIVLYSGPLKQQPQASTPAAITPQKGTQKDLSGKAPTVNGNDSKTVAQKTSQQPQTANKKVPRVIKAHYSGPILPTRESKKEIPQTTLETIKEPEKTLQKPLDGATQEITAETPSLFQAAEKPHSINEEEDSDGIRRRRLELADLFKTMPHLMDKLSQEAGNGEQLVVVQGDMKYYSFLKTFLDHINQVFAFHGGPQKLHTFAQQGKIKRNAAMSVVIDREGKVLSKTLTHSSGHGPADSIILDALELASPFPPVPPHFTHKTVRVELISMVR